MAPHSAESPRKETIAVWIIHALFISETPLGALVALPGSAHCGTTEVDVFMLERTVSLEYFHLSKPSHVCFANKNPLVEYSAAHI